VVVRLGLVAPELAAVSLDATPPYDTVGCESAAFRILDLSSWAGILLRAGIH
jgi:hypothetical protein